MRRAGWAAVCAAVVLAAAGGGVTAALAGGGTVHDPPLPPAPAAHERPAADSADAGFARDMAVHHQQAVEMSFVVRDRTDDEEVRRLAYDIANTQANQRGMLLGWLDLWGLPKVSAGPPMAWMGMGGHGGHGGGPGDDGRLMPGMATKAELAELRKADGERAEVLFLQLMTAHHKGGVHMAQGCVDRCRPGVERDLAEGMVAAQESELKLMSDLLKARGAKPG
ncbi:DUF305 domain-containing protein [Streptomyces sp. B-S-A8]|uniref:DUF305 domain-containing protein n=1 Tax=Streptomyces solicavernae TaxID=3043614 RepID=A0ABT6RS44_9ACTN|nr:DUF305 domain-containing protein [Streptomyces sp. B-S-A8]MDI3387261.1 DUF305 domain-containing protein [Streptomyces sp. B-S-A8]